MDKSKLQALLLVVIITGYILLPISYAYPHTLSTYSLEGNPQEPLRKKRHIFDDVVKIGKSVAKYGDGILRDIKTSVNLKAHNVYYKDLERLCRNIRGPPANYDILCLENLGNSVFEHTIGKAFGFVADKTGATRKPSTTTRKPATTTRKSTTTTTTRKPWPRVNIDLLFVLPTLSTPMPTIPEKPYDWPDFILGIVDKAGDSIREFGENIQSEMNRLVDRLENGEVAKSIISSADSIENMVKSIDAINLQLQNISKSIDDVSLHIDDGAKSIETAVNNAASTIAAPLDRDIKNIATSINTGADSIGTSVKDSSVGIQSSIDNGVKSIESTMDKDSQSIQTSLDTGMQSVAASVEDGSKLIQASVDNAADTIQKELDQGKDSIKTSIDLGAISIETSIDSSSTKIQGSLDTGLKNIEIAIKTALGVQQSTTTRYYGAKTSMDDGMLKIEQTLSKISDFLDKLEQLFGTVPSELDATTDVINSHQESKIFQVIKEILENIRNNQSEAVKDKRDILSMFIDELADGMLANDNSISALVIKEIAKEIKNIETDEVDAVENFGIQLEKLGTALKENDEIYPGVKTDLLFKSIGTIMKVLPKYGNNGDM